MEVDETIYRDLIMTRARAPRHGSPLACYDAEAAGDNPMCGDRLTVQVRRNGAGAVEDVGFSARGCAISIASADLMADAVQGLGEHEVRALSAQFATMVSTGEVPRGERFNGLAALSGVHAFRSRMRCATLAWSALERALEGGR